MNETTSNPLGDALLTRRSLLQSLGAGLMFAVLVPEADAQITNQGAAAGTGERGDQRRRERASANLAARLHIAADGTVTVMTGKVECGQGARAQITQAVAEELRVSTDRVQVIMGDTDLCPDDGPTVGSRTTPSTIPSVRRGAACARETLVGLAAAKWDVSKDQVRVSDGQIRLADGSQGTSYGELVGEEWSKQATDIIIPNEGVELTRVEDWTVLGAGFDRPNGRDIVTGKHLYPSDITRPEMLHGAVLRPPALGSRLESIDLDVARKIDPSIVVTRAGDFVGVAAPKAYLNRWAVSALRESANWSTTPPVDSDRLFEHLRATAREPERLSNPHADRVDNAPKSLKAEYHVSYVQHVPLEPRAAVAEWDADGKLTVWTATQNPLRVRGELQEAFGLSPQQVRVIVPDFGGAFGGKHTGECAVEAARIAREAKKPVSLRWSRREEFQWASFRPAALILCEAGLDAANALDSWHFVNINSGGAALNAAYRCANKQQDFVESTDPPLRHGSYRALAATANHFARESFMDELAHLAGEDPLAFRLKHLEDERIANVLKAAAEKFDWTRRSAEKNPSRGVGLACGTEKNSVVAACVEVEIDPQTREIRVLEVCQAFECGKIMNPPGLLAQVNGAIVQGLGPALWEAIEFKDGIVSNGRLKNYRVPRFSDVPKLDTVLLDRPDLPSAGGSETPIVAVAPAIANAVFHASGQRVRTMPIRMREA